MATHVRIRKKQKRGAEESGGAGQIEQKTVVRLKENCTLPHNVLGKISLGGQGRGLYPKQTQGAGEHFRQKGRDPLTMTGSL